MARGMRSSPNIHSVESCLVLSGNYCCCCMCCCWNTLHEVYTSQIVNNNVHKSSKTIFDNDNIHWSLCMTRKKWKTSLYMWAPFYNGIIPTIFETYSELTLPQTTYQMDTQIIPNGYPNHWWYDRSDVMKDVQPEDVRYQGKYHILHLPIFHEWSSKKLCQLQIKHSQVNYQGAAVATSLHISKHEQF